MTNAQNVEGTDANYVQDSVRSTIERLTVDLAERKKKMSEAPTVNPYTAKRKVQTPETAADIMRIHLGQITDEHLVVVLLDAQDHEIATITVQEGTPDTCLTSVEKIMIEAIRHHARGVIMGHNHPGGSAQPSKQDLAFFDRLKAAFSYLDHTRLLDCIIVGDQTGEVYSHRRNSFQI